MLLAGSYQGRLVNVNKVFERNISVLKDNQLREKLINYEYITKPILATTNGYNVQYNGIYLHSEENPLVESQQICQKSLNENKSIHIIYGLGLGYLFQLMAKHSNSMILVYEPNLDILYNSFTLVDFSQELSKDNIYIFDDLDKLLNYLSLNTKQNTTVDILALPSYREIYKETFDEEVKKIELAYGSVLLDYGYKKKRLYGSTVTMLKNIPQLLKETPVNKFENIYSGKTAIVVSAGPTLGDNIETLKKYQDKAVIFTVGTALKTLVENNIKPDFLCMIESFDCTKQVKDIDLSDINLIVEPYTNENIHSLDVKNVLLHLSSNMPSSQYFADIAELSTEGYLAQGTVSYMALNTAVKMGFSKIILVGQDLAYIDGQCYSKDSAYDGLSCKFNSELNKYEIVPNDLIKYADSICSYKTQEDRVAAAKRRLTILNSSLYMVKSIDGKMLPTESGYASFIAHFISYAKQLTDIKLINTSLKGAKLDGFEDLSLEDAMKDEKIINKLDLDMGYDYDIQSVLDSIKLSKQNLESFLEIANECGKLASRLNMDYKRNPVLDKDNLLKIRKLIEEYTKLNDNNRKDNLIFKYTTAEEEMNLNDVLTSIKKYDEKTTPVAISGLKKYYDVLNKRIPNIIKILSDVICEVNG